MTATHSTLQKIIKLIAGRKEILFSVFSWDFIFNNNNNNNKISLRTKKKLRKLETDKKSSVF